MPDMQLFELIEHLDAGGTAHAKQLTWNGTSYAPLPDARPIKLHDFVGSHGMIGDRGYCFHSWNSNRWEVAGGIFTPGLWPHRVA